MPKLPNTTECCGCSACYSVCPKSAITMTENDEGFLSPVIDKSKCIECQRCEKVCPEIESLANKSNLQISYAVINKDEDLRLKSSSGGVFSALAENVIDNNGVVFGAKFAADFSVIHSWTDTKKGLADFRGSKYLQSSISDTYKQCKEFLGQGRQVLFTGTPCQIQGLKKYLGRDYANLLTVDLICHGTPSNKLWQKYIDYVCDKNDVKRDSIVKISFRRKNCGWKRYSLSFTFANGSEYSEPQNTGKYMQTFNRNIMMRMSCYNCPAKDDNIVSDIIIGDFWGIGNYLEMDDDKGTSIIYANTDKGATALNATSSKLDIIEIKDYDALRYNTQLVQSISIHKNREKFIRMCISDGFEKAYNKYVQSPLPILIYKKIRHFAGRILREIGLKK